MTSEQILILIDNIQNSQVPLSKEKCADLLGIPSATFQKQLGSLRSVFEENGFRIEGKTGYGNGYRIYVDDAAKYYEYRDNILPKLRLAEIESLTNQKNRVRKLIKIFLDSDDYIKLDDVADELMVSKSQFNKDLQEAKQFFQKYGITLESKPHYGSKIVADEIAYRAALTKTLMNEIGVDEENGLLRPVFFEEEKDMLEDIRKIIIDCAKEYDFALTDLTIQNLTLHLYIAIKRINMGRPVDIDKKLVEKLLEENERPLAARIAHILNSKYGISFNVEELCYIIMHLSAKKIAKEESIDDEVMEIIDDMFRRVKERFNYDFMNNLDLRITLGMHTIPLLKRISFHLVSYNPLKEEIQQKYFRAYDVALWACKAIEEKFDCELKDDEISYYALHFKMAIDNLKASEKKNILIVCSSGRATSQMLRINFEKSFSNQLNRIDTCNYFELQNINLKNYDCVFSTVPIKEKYDIPIFKIKSFFEVSSINSINNLLNGIDKNMEEDYPFSEKLFFNDICAVDREDALKQICQRISEVKKLPNNFLQSVLERENMQATRFEDVALPHTNGVIGDENIIAVTILKNPIEWNNGLVQLVILSSYRDDFIKNNDKFFSFLLEIIKQSKTVKSILGKPTYSNFIECYKKFVEKGEKL